MQMDDRTHLARSLLDIQTLETPEELADALNVISARYGLSHVTFLALRTGSTSPLTPFYASTYPQEWINTYVVNDYIAIDPVVAIARTGLLPVDWSLVKRQSGEVTRFFDDAIRHGVGPNGLAIPIRGANGERCLFSVSSDLPNEDWAVLKRSIVHELHIIAYYLHEEVMTISGLRQPGMERDLSMRERQCLQLLASGKIYKQIAAALDVSESAVRIYIRSARRKLNATTSHHAVAKASYLELIEF